MNQFEFKRCRAAAAFAVGAARQSSLLRARGLPIDHAVAAQRDFRLVVAEVLTQDFHRTLTQARRCGRRKLGRTVKFDRAADEAQTTGRPVFRFDHHLAREGMRVGERGADAEHRRMRHIEGRQLLLPLGDRARAGDLGDQAVDLVAVIAAQRRGRKARVLREIRPFQGGCPAAAWSTVNLIAPLKPLGRATTRPSTSLIDDGGPYKDVGGHGSSPWAESPRNKSGHGVKVMRSLTSLR